MIKIIVSPAKKMNVEREFSGALTIPVYLNKALNLHRTLRTLSSNELQALWKCNDKITALNYERLHTASPDGADTPALLAYEGLQYQHMSPQVFSSHEWAYVTKHLRILSGFYGILKPTDAIIPYRLEMQACLKTNSFKNLYEYWGDSLYLDLLNSSAPNSTCELLNLASAEYSKAVLPHIGKNTSCTSCIFGELIDGKVKTKATQAKMARGEMVRWMAEYQIENIEDIVNFDRLGFRYEKNLSKPGTLLFLKSK